MISDLPTADLAQRCAEETDHYTRQRPNDSQFCFELLRRACAAADADAFTMVYQIYERLAISWVHRHTRFPLTGESAEFFAGDAFRTFYFALSGPKFERFPTLAAALSYLRLCVHTAIAQYLRDHERLQTVPVTADTDFAEMPDLGARVDADELWDAICRLLPDERDRLLARCAFVLQLKPREICAAYRMHWSSARDVTVALYRIRRLLCADPGLAARVGLALDREAGSA